MKIAVIEDDSNIRDLIKIVLSELNISIDEYDNGWKGLDGVLAENYSILILDLMLPGINGLEICKKVRQYNTKLPILMLTSKSEFEDKIIGLENGADDYLTKPFNNGELIARVKALLRRTEQKLKTAASELKEITIGDLLLNIPDKTLYKKNELINLTVKEYELILLFMTQPGRNFTRMEVLEKVWGDEFEGLEHTVNSNINRLRIKIEKDPANPKYLVTVWGVGYRFNKNPDF